MISTSIPDNSGKQAHPFSPTLLQIQLNSQTFYARGRAAQVLYIMINAPDRFHSAEMLARRVKSVHVRKANKRIPLFSPSPTLKTGIMAVHQAVGQIRKAMPNLLYKGDWGKGWRIATGQHPHILWEDPRLREAISQQVLFSNPLVTPRA